MFEFKFGKRYLSKRFLSPPPINPPPPPRVPLYLGCRIHLKSRNGTYEVIFFNDDYARITCKTWVTQRQQGQRTNNHQLIHRSDVKCLHGHDKIRK